MEVAVTLLLSILATGLMVEISRRVLLQIALHHTAFFYVRARVLGADVREAKRSARAWQFLVGRGLEITEHTNGSGELKARVHFRYRSLFEFPIHNQMKHHFEVTQTCTFPFSH